MEHILYNHFTFSLYALVFLVNLSSWRDKIEEDEGVLHGEDEEGEEEVKDSADDNPDHTYHKHEAFKDGILTIGCVG